MEKITCPVAYAGALPRRVVAWTSAASRGRSAFGESGDACASAPEPRPAASEIASPIPHGCGFGSVRTERQGARPLLCPDVTITSPSGWPVESHPGSVNGPHRTAVPRAWPICLRAVRPGHCSARNENTARSSGCPIRAGWAKYYPTLFFPQNLSLYVPFQLLPAILLHNRQKNKSNMLLCHYKEAISCQCLVHQTGFIRVNP